MRKLFLVLVFVLLPACAYAQTLGYQTLTPTGAAYLYMGLGMQWTLRASRSMINLPAAIVICGVLYLLLKQAISANPAPIASVVAYFLSTCFVLVMFWPEAVAPLTSQLNYQIYPNAVTSIAQVSGGFPGPKTAKERLENLASAALIPGGPWPFEFHGNLMTITSTEVPPAFHLLLRTAVDLPRELAVALNSDATKPFLRSLSFQGLYGLEAYPETDDLLAVEGIECYKQVVNQLAVDGSIDLETMDWKSYLPWEAPVYDAMEDNGGNNFWTEVMTETYRGDTLTGDVVDGSVRCIDVWDFIWGDFERALAQPVHPDSTDRIHDVIATTTHLSKNQQIAMLIYRNMQRFAPKAIESTTAESLRNAGMAIGAATAAANVVDVVSSTVQGAAVGMGVGASVGVWAFGVGAIPAGAVGGFLGAAAGFMSAILTAAKPVLDQLMGFVKPAMIVIYFMPYITGMISAVTVGFFPFVVLWSLFPGQHFKPLANYFLVLLWAQSAPLWYAFADAMSQFAYRSVGGNQTNIQEIEKVLNFIEGNAVGVFVGVAAIFMVPMMEAIILFGAWRAIGSAFRGGL